MSGSVVNESTSVYSACGFPSGVSQLIVGSTVEHACILFKWCARVYIYSVVLSILYCAISQMAPQDQLSSANFVLCTLMTAS